MTGTSRRDSASRSAAGFIRGVGLCAALVGAVVVAQRSAEGAGVSEPDSTALPAIKVDLPPPPSFTPPNIPLAYDDGSVSIYGLRKQLIKDREAKAAGKETKYLDKQVKVKANLLEIYQCPVCPKKQTCKPCDQPHFYLIDAAYAQGTPKREKAILVADYRNPKAKDPKVTAGKEYVVEATFTLNTPSGFGSSDGLLLFRQMVDDSTKPYLGPIIETEKAAAEEKEKYEKAMKAAKGK